MQQLFSLPHRQLVDVGTYQCEYHTYDLEEEVSVIDRKILVKTPSEVNLEILLDTNYKVF